MPQDLSEIILICRVGAVEKCIIISKDEKKLLNIFVEIMILTWMTAYLDVRKLILFIYLFVCFLPYLIWKRILIWSGYEDE